MDETDEFLNESAFHSDEEGFVEIDITPTETPAVVIGDDDLVDHSDAIKRLCQAADMNQSYVSSIASDSNPFILELLLKLDHIVHPSVDEEESVVSLRASLVEATQLKLAAEADNRRALDSFDAELKKATEELISVKHQVEVNAAEKTSLDKLNASLTADLSSSRAQLSALSQENVALKAAAMTSDEEKKTLILLIEKRQRDLERITEEATKLRSFSESARAELCELKKRIAEIEGGDLTNKHLLESREQELVQAKKHSEWLSDELNRKNEESRKYRTEKNEELFTLQTKVSTQFLDLQSINTTFALTQTRNQDLETRLTQSQQSIQDQATRTALLTNQYTSELQNQTKLANLYQKKCEEVEQRNIELERYVGEIVEASEDAARRFEVLEEENGLVVGELKSRLAECEVVVDEQAAELRLINASFVSSTVKDTPVLSDTASAASRLQKSGKTFTQVLQESLIVEKREVSRLTANLDHFLKQLNDNAPIHLQLKQDYDQLHAQHIALTRDLATATSVKDKSLRSLNESKARCQSLDLENRNLNQDCKDLAKQLQVLLTDLELAGGSSGSLEEGLRILRKSLQNQTESTDQSNDAQNIISERLVVFHSCQELQSQNQKMRRSLRSLSKQLEDKSANTSQQHAQEIELAKQTLAEMQEQIRTQSLKCESFIRERDQWKRIAETRQKQSPGHQDVATNSDLQFQTLHKQLQHDFDAYRKEIGQDSRMLQGDLERATAAHTASQISLARVTTQLNYQQERYQSLQSSQDLHLKEHAELRDRMARLATTITYQDAKAQELTNTLIEAKEEHEVARCEARQLRIEKEILKQSEVRLVGENRSLVVDRGRCQDLIRDMQKMQDETAFGNSELVKKLEARIEKDGKDLKQAYDYVDDLRSLNAKRDAELNESRVIIDKLNVNLQNATKESALAKQQVDNLTLRSHELTARLATTEEKLKIYESRASPSNTQSTNDSARGLELQIADIRGELETCKESLKLEKEKVETYLAIASASEEQLANINATYDTYKDTMDQQQADSQAHLQALEAKCTELEQRLATAVSEVTLAQESASEERSSWESEKRSMQVALEQAHASEAEAVDGMTLARADLTRQLETVQEMQINYEREIVAHSRNIQTLTTLREELSTLKSTTQTLDTKLRLAESDTQIAQKALQESTAQHLTEKKELETRIAEYIDQNATLHKHIDRINAQALNLQSQSQDSLALGEQVVDPTDKLHKELREVIRFLRRERDILSTKYELVQQENERTKAQIEYAQSTLDETRAVLNEERQKNREALDGERRHAQLVEQVNQVNVLRESNQTLRDQAEASTKKITVLQKRVEASEDTINPLRAELLGLQAEAATKATQIRLLEEDNTRWKTRTQQILSKYERIDPIEHQKLTDDNKALVVEIAEIRGQIGVLAATHADELKATVTRGERNESLLKKSTAYIQKLQVDLTALKADTTTAKSNSHEEQLKSQIEELEAKNEALQTKLAATTASRLKNNEAFRRNTALLKESLAEAEKKLVDVEAEQKVNEEAALGRNHAQKKLDVEWHARLRLVETNAASLKKTNEELQRTISLLQSSANKAKVDSPATPKRRYSEEETVVAKKIKTVAKISEEIAPIVEESACQVDEPIIEAEIEIVDADLIEDAVEDDAVDEERDLEALLDSLNDEDFDQGSEDDTQDLDSTKQLEEYEDQFEESDNSENEDIIEEELVDEASRERQEELMGEEYENFSDEVMPEVQDGANSSVENIQTVDADDDQPLSRFTSEFTSTTDVTNADEKEIVEEEMQTGDISIEDVEGEQIEDEVVETEIKEVEVKEVETVAEKAVETLVVEEKVPVEAIIPKPVTIEAPAAVKKAPTPTIIVPPVALLRKSSVIAAPKSAMAKEKAPVSSIRAPTSATAPLSSTIVEPTLPQPTSTTTRKSAAMNQHLMQRMAELAKKNADKPKLAPLPIPTPPVPAAPQPRQQKPTPITFEEKPATVVPVQIAGRGGKAPVRGILRTDRGRGANKGGSA